MVLKLANYCTNVPPPGKTEGFIFTFLSQWISWKSATCFSAGYTLVLWQFSWNCTFERLT